MNNFDEKKLIQEFSKIQSELSPRIKLENNFQIEEIQFIAGVDLAYWDVNKTKYGTCCIVIIDYGTKEVVEKYTVMEKYQSLIFQVSFAFRELPLIIEAVKKLTKQPDIYIFDGNGYLHYRHMGIATHASFLLNKPTIGVAKVILKFEM